MDLVHKPFWRAVKNDSSNMAVKKAIQLLKYSLPFQNTSKYLTRKSIKIELFLLRNNSENAVSDMGFYLLVVAMKPNFELLLSTLRNLS